MIYVKCAICGSNEVTHVLYQSTLNLRRVNRRTFSARRSPDRVHYRIVCCSNCGLIFSNPILEPRKIIGLYRKSDFNYGEESQYLKETYGSYLKRNLPHKDLKSIKLLDIGAGNGFFLEKAKEIGINDVWGIEPGMETLKKVPKDLRRRIKKDVLREGLFKKNSFDVICCFHTLDHIIDPNKFLQVVYELLRGGGKVLFIVHDTDGLSVKMFGEKSPIFDIEHIYLFNKKTLRRIFKKNGFTNIRTFDVKNTYPLSYWQRMMPFPTRYKNLISHFLTISNLGKIPVGMKGGNIGIAAAKK